MSDYFLFLPYYITERINVLILHIFQLLFSFFIFVSKLELLSIDTLYFTGQCRYYDINCKLLLLFIFVNMFKKKKLIVICSVHILF